MTAQSASIEPTVGRRIRSGMFLGFTTVFRKELTEWLRGPKALLIAGVSIAGAVFMTLLPFIAQASGEAEAAGLTSMDPTANVLVGWTGQSVALIAVVATMAIISTERDRGTLAWSLTNPVSPTSIIAAKLIAAMAVFSVAAVLLPLAVSVCLATVVYGGMPDLATIATFGLLFLTLPAFLIALTIGLGTAIKSTAGVAGAAFVVVLVPQIVGGLLPIVGQLSPTSMGAWALAIAKGEPAAALTPVAWIVSMALLVIGSIVVFDRQEF